MQLTIVREDNVVIVDGEVLIIPCDSLPSNLHAVQWVDTAGHEEWTDADNTEIDSMAAYQGIVDAWQTQKDFNDARELDPFHGMVGEELFDAQNAADEAAVRITFATDSLAPVFSNGQSWNGGEGSAASINNAVDLAENQSEANVVITDIDNIKRTLTFVVARAVSADIGLAYRTAFYIKQDALVEIAGRVYS